MIQIKRLSPAVAVRNLDTTGVLEEGVCDVDIGICAAEKSNLLHTSRAEKPEGTGPHRIPVGTLGLESVPEQLSATV